MSESGEVSGTVRLVEEPNDLDHEWDADDIVVLSHNLEQFFEDNPKALADLFKNVHAVLAEFGESLGIFATLATEHTAIGVVGLRDAIHVLEDGMHIRIEASENQCDIFFID